MKRLGLTGGIGMGKSTAAHILAQRGVPVVDTDLLARQVVAPGQPALTEIQKAFGRGVIATDGSLHRGELARIVFSDPAAREKLEAITHPRIRELWQAQTQAWREEGKEMGVVVIPLLFETKAESEFDAVICAACSAASQQQRLAQRGWTPEQIQMRIAAQWPVERKIQYSEYLLWTEGPLEILAEQLLRVIP